MGINGVIVDLVEEITKSVSDFNTPATERDGEEVRRLKSSQQELTFLLKLIPELIQQ